MRVGTVSAALPNSNKRRGAPARARSWPKRAPPRPSAPPQDKWDKQASAGLLDKGEAKRRRGVGGGGLRTLAGLLLGLGLFAIGMRWEPTYANIVQQLRMGSEEGGFDSSERWLPAESQQPAAAAAARPAEEPPVGDRFLAFDVCGDFATQRVALMSGGGMKGRSAGVQREAPSSPAAPMRPRLARQPPAALAWNARPLACSHRPLRTPPRAVPRPTHLFLPPRPRPAGLVLAAEANRTLVLPRLLVEGRPVEFWEVFDLDQFTAGMHAQALRFVARLPPGARPRALHLGEAWDMVGALQAGDAAHRVLKCAPGGGCSGSRGGSGTAPAWRSNRVLQGQPWALQRVSRRPHSPPLPALRLPSQDQLPRVPPAAGADCQARAAGVCGGQGHAAGAGAAGHPAEVRRRGGGGGGGGHCRLA